MTSDMEPERRAKARSLRVLVLNPGSSTLKAAVLEPPGRGALATATVEWGADATLASGRAAGVASVLGAVEAAGVERASIDAVGYRVVHGGTRFVDPALIEDATVDAIEELAELAPLHNRIAAETIRAARQALPGIPHVAAFDTAFHAGLPPAGYRYPVPEAWFRDWGIRRFGFHGLSVAWSVARTAELLGRPVDGLRLVIAHLGSGCSVTAVDDGRSVDTSMGMTPLEGLMMGTRAGSIDPGILLALLRDGRATVAELEDVLDHRSGLLGLSGRSADVRILFECKRRSSREVERSEVAVLHDCLRQTGSHKAVMVSTVGFQSGAVTYAKQHGIALVRIVKYGVPAGVEVVLRHSMSSLLEEQRDDLFYVFDYESDRVSCFGTGAFGLLNEIEDDVTAPRRW